MDNIEDILKELQKLLTDLNIELKYARGNFQGGFCKFKGKKVLFLNRAQPADNHVSLIVSELEKIAVKVDKEKISSKIKKLLQKSSIN